MNTVGEIVACKHRHDDCEAAYIRDNVFLPMPGASPGRHGGRLCGMGAQAQPRPTISVGEIRCFSYSTGKFLSRNLNLLPLAKMFIKPAILQDVVIASSMYCNLGLSPRPFVQTIWPCAMVRRSQSGLFGMVGRLITCSCVVV